MFKLALVALVATMCFAAGAAKPQMYINGPPQQIGTVSFNHQGFQQPNTVIVDRRPSYDNFVVNYEQDAPAPTKAPCMIGNLMNAGVDTLASAAGGAAGLFGGLIGGTLGVLTGDVKGSATAGALLPNVLTGNVANSMKQAWNK